MHDDPPRTMSSIVLACVWTIAGFALAAVFAFFLYAMFLADVDASYRFRHIPLIMSLTLTPLVLGLGWVPVVWTKHRGTASPLALGAGMVLAGGGMMVLNTLIVPIFTLMFRDLSP